MVFLKVKYFDFYVFQTVEFLNEKLEKREAQLLSLSKEKAFLEEAYDNLKE
jgi:cell division protein FtsB